MDDSDEGDSAGLLAGKDISNIDATQSDSDSNIARPNQLGIGPYSPGSLLTTPIPLADSIEEICVVTESSSQPQTDLPDPETSRRPSTARSSFRSFVRKLTPKRKLKPILVKAGIRKETTADDRDLRVTFEMPGASEKDTSSSTEIDGCFSRFCAKPLIPFAGTLSFLGGVTFGYDIGIISGVLQPLREHFRLSCKQEQILVGCLITGALIVSLCGGPWIDKCGRRRAILIACCIFILGSVLSAIAGNLDLFAAGRLLQGFGMSLSTVAECVYISEIAPKEKRGFMVGLNEFGITIGFVLAFFVGLVFIGVPDSWRYMMGIGAVPTVLQLVGTYFLLPPSPREKMMNKADKEAILILENLRDSRNDAMNEFAAIRHALVIEESYGTLSLFRSADNMLFRFLVGISLVFLQQVSGQPNILYYSSVVFEQVGFGQTGAAVATLGLGVVKVVSTALALAFTDRRGRRFFLITGTLMMALSISVVGISTLISPPLVQPPCHRVVNTTFTDVHSISSRPVTHGSHPPSHPAQLIADVVFLMLYIVGYSISFGPMTWLVLTELFPSGIKGRAISFTNVVNWASNLVVSLTFLDLMTALTPGGTFLLFAAVNLLGALYIFLVIPETMGKSLERISYELRTTRPKQRFDENLNRLMARTRRRKAVSTNRSEYEPVSRTSSV